MTGSGSKDLIIGRQDGNIEVFVVNILDATDVSILMFVYVRNVFIFSTYLHLLLVKVRLRVQYLL